MTCVNGVSFENTEIAFAHQSNTQLFSAYWLFKMLAYPQLVKLGKWGTAFAFRLKLPISPVFRYTLFEQFVGGETIEACERSIQALAQYQIGTILDYSIEGKTDARAFAQTQAELLRIVERAAGDDRIPFVVFKLSALARAEVLSKASRWQELSPQEAQELAQLKSYVQEICERARDCQTPVLIDAEESWIQPVIDQIALEMMQTYNREQAWVWNTLQMYRSDRLKTLDDLLSLASKEGFQLGIKLVRGAYMEKEREYAAQKGLPSPIYPSKAATDEAYNQALETCLTHLKQLSVCVGSHNEASNYLMLERMQALGIEPSEPRIWFAQLLGMSDHISFNLAQAGYHTAKYVPYAPIPDLIPYLIRRAEENTSVQGQSSRELSLIKKEMQRRKLL